MTALHDAEFRHLDLGPTMSGINKLNLPGGNVMRGTIMVLLSGNSTNPLLP